MKMMESNYAEVRNKAAINKTKAKQLEPHV